MRSRGFHKRTITPQQFAQAAASVLADAPVFYRIWVAGTLDPGFREKLMLAVARANEAKYCSWAHHEWALIEDVPEKELADIERSRTAGLDRKTDIAVSFVRKLVAAGFDPAPKKLLQEMREHYTAEEIGEITYVARVMDVMNLSSNTFEAFVSRLNGNPPRGQIVDEAIMSAIFCCAVPPLFTFFSRSSGLTNSELAHRMVEYTMKMDAESPEERPRRRRPVGKEVRRSKNKAQRRRLPDA